ncbi:MAG TPA: D-glycerate dehydrogenase [Rubrivivax sp.]|jgi:gluconate 2-dehydrogenase|nr:D-glycerate dehydrogenase [Burkholderiaceae bacterium]MCP5289963.1 D-glycerate dehydrogenase [Burkholderiaceae bacterium]HMQ71212.1 D-glycerate dehydrogenase [Rubrivivax sp.]HMR69464.1 D-glycerate dehydrogenase [Rubrivivax sp.]
MTPRPSVLVARAVFPEAVARLREHFDVVPNPDDREWSRDELSGRLQGMQGLLATAGEPIDVALLDAHPQLRAVCLMTVGYNNVDVDACTARGVLVTNAPGVLTETTADLGFALMMAAARRFSEAERFLRSGAWNEWRVDLLAGRDVHGATLGILGMGRIGQAIARRGALGFGMKVIYHNRSRLPAAAEAPLAARWVDKATLLAESDHLVLVLPYTPANRHAIGAAELSRMKPTATLTNIARGGIVDDAALAAALRAGRLFAAGLDVYENEPAVHPELLTLPNVVLLPHIGSATEATRRAMVGCAVDNLIAALTGAVPPTPVNPQVLS